MGLTMTKRIEPLSFTGSNTGSQFAEPTSLTCWRVKPIAVEGHEIITVFVRVSEMARLGGSGSSTWILPLTEVVFPWSSRAVTVRLFAPIASGGVKLKFGLAPQLLQTVIGAPPFN